MARHRSERSLGLIDALLVLGAALGYVGDSEYQVTESGGAVDVAWLRDRRDRVPLFIFEVETTASSSAANNPLKVFAQPSAELPKPLFFFHVFLSSSERSERIALLERQYGTQNYGTYRIGAGDATDLVKDVLAHQRRVVDKVNILKLVTALQHPAWDPCGLDVDAALVALETERYTACYVPHYTTLSRRDPRFLPHLVRQISSRPIPWANEDECWYDTYLGSHWSVPIHLALLAHLLPDQETEMLDRLRTWQEGTDEMRQIGPYFGLSYDYDKFLLGLSGPLWAFIAALFPSRDAKRYCSSQLRFLIDGLDTAHARFAIFPAIWLLWLAVAAGQEEDYQAASELITGAGGVNPRLVEQPPSIILVDEDDGWWLELDVDAAPPQPFADFEKGRRSQNSNAPDIVALALDALMDERVIYEWAPWITAALHTSDGAT